MIPGFVHLYAGEEAVAVGRLPHLSDDDYITSTHRGHGHCIAKGVDIAGDDGRADGQGDRHLQGQGRLDAHRRRRRRACSAPTASSAAASRSPCGAGADREDARHAARSRSASSATAPSNQGTFHEALNLAAIWKLPVVFVCENNGYAESTPVELPLLGRATSPTAPPATGSPAWSSTASTSFAVYEAAGEAIARARRGEGPTLIEAKTYRFYGHDEGDAAHLSHRRGGREVPRTATRSTTFERATSTANGIATEADLDAIRPTRQATVDAAYAAGAAAPWPEPGETARPTSTSATSGR